MTAPLVSVVIPVYNGERYLTEAIASILGQTVRPAEIVIVDDGSTDSTSQIVAAFADVASVDIRYARQDNQGPAVARNTGIRMSTGDLLAFLDADDLWAPIKLALQLQAIEASPDLEAVLGHVEEFVSPDIDAATARRLRAARGNYPGYHAGTLLIDREVFRRIGYFDEDLRFGEFIDWWARAMDNGLTYLMLPDLAMRRRLHGDNYTLRHQAHKRDYLKVARAALMRHRGR